MLIKISRIDEGGTLTRTKLVDIPFTPLTPENEKKAKKEKIQLEINGYSYILKRDGKLQKKKSINEKPSI